MTCKLKLIVAAFLFSIIMIEPAFAYGSMRCGSHVITAGGDNAPGKYEVLKRCGDPDVRYGHTWIYERSSTVTRIVRFNSDGQLSSIN